MPAKTRKKRQSGNKNNQLFIFLAIVIVLAIISMAVAYYLTIDGNSEAQTIPAAAQNEVSSTTDTDTSVGQIEGTWVSTYDGAMLTITGLSFSLELSGVDAAAKMTGNIAVEGNIVTFVYITGNESCNNIEGHYLYSVEDNGDLFFKLIKDQCSGRTERMSVSWFKI